MENRKSTGLIALIWSLYLCINTPSEYKEIVEIYEAFGVSITFKTLDIILLIVSGVSIGVIYKKCSKKKSNIICFLIIITWILFWLRFLLVMRVYNGSYLFDVYGM